VATSATAAPEIAAREAVLMLVNPAVQESLIVSL
jgi:hypothetical protein